MGQKLLYIGFAGIFIICVKQLFNFSLKHQIYPNLVCEKSFCHLLFCKKVGKKLLYIGFVEILFICVESLFNLSPTFCKKWDKNFSTRISGNGFYLRKMIVQFDPQTPKNTSNLTARKVFATYFFVKK